MLIKRNVYFSAIDQETGEERLFSVNEILDEKSYLERLYSEDETDEREFSEKKDKKMRLGDKLHIGANKHLSYGKYRKAQIDMLDDDKETAKKGRHNLSKEIAKCTAAGGAIGGAIAGAKAGGIKGAVVGGLASGALSGAGGYVGGRVGSKIGRGVRNISSTNDAISRRKRDQIKVADGQMSKEEFTKKYGKNK